MADLVWPENDSRDNYPSEDWNEYEAWFDGTLEDDRFDEANRELQEQEISDN